MTILGVFFTRGVNLRKWFDSGLLDREVLLYREHIRTGSLGRVYWFVYGVEEPALTLRLRSEGRLPPEISIVPWPPWMAALGRAASLTYTVLLPWLARAPLRSCDLYKTNQMDGAIAAVLAARLWKKPLYIRTGYTLSRVAGEVHRHNPLRRAWAWLTEFLAFRYGDCSSVSSQYDLRHVQARYRFGGQRPVVMGNFVDTVAFAPEPAAQRQERMIYVGRFSAEKNLEAAVRACALAGIGLDLIGDGVQKPQLQALARNVGADVKCLGIVPNALLPGVLQQYRYFVLPSLWEGMPKALLEAMSMGLVCIGNRTSGIEELIEDGSTGYLSTGPDPASLVTAIQRARDNDWDKVSRAAREYVAREFSLPAIAGREAAMFASLVARRQPGREGRA